MADGGDASSQPDADDDDGDDRKEEDDDGAEIRIAGTGPKPEAPAAQPGQPQPGQPVGAAASGAIVASDGTAQPGSVSAHVSPLPPSPPLPNGNTQSNPLAHSDTHRHREVNKDLGYSELCAPEACDVH